jgi:hypothetical protein
LILLAYLFAILSKNVIELLHHLFVESFSRPDVFKLQQHVKRRCGRTQLLERLVDETDDFFFKILETDTCLQ